MRGDCMRRRSRNTWVCHGRFVRPILFGIVLMLGGSISQAQTKPPASGQQPPPGPQGLPGVADKSGKKTLTIKVPDAGERYIRILPSDSKAAQLPISFLDTSKVVTIDPSVVGKSPRIAVDDAKTGNTALIPPAGHVSADGGTIELGKIDFDHVRQVKVVVTYDNKPVQIAQVTLGTDKAASAKTIDPSLQGVATFDDVPAGKTKLTIVYGDKLTESKDVEISLDHPGPFLTINAPVTNKVATLNTVPPISAGTSTPATQSTPAAGSGGGQQASPPPHEGGGFAGFLGTLIGIAAAGGVIYLFYRWSKSGGMAATLKKAGIEVTGTPPSDAGTPWNPNAPAAPVVSDPTMCQFCGQKRDAAGNCACTLSGTAINTGPASPVVATQPRLVATMGTYSGQIFPLNGAGVTVGREPTNTIALADDTTVSRRHASFRAEGGRYLVTDEGSSNGIYVNGVKIAGSQPLNPGDEVQIGNTRFRFEV